MSRKRSGQEAGIKIHVKKEDFESGAADEEPEEDDQQHQVDEAPKAAPPVPVEKKKAKRPWLSSGGEDGGMKNPFAGTGAKFGTTSGLSFNSGAFGGSTSASTGKDLPSAATSTTPATSIFGSFGSTGAAQISKPSTTAAATLFSAKEQQAPPPAKANDTPAPFSFGSSTTGGASKSNGSAGGGEEEYFRSIAALNTSFRQWVETKVKEKADASLVNGVRMYIDYCTRIEGGNQAVETRPAPQPVPQKASASSLFSKPADAANATGTSHTASSSSLFASSSKPAEASATMPTGLFSTPALATTTPSLFTTTAPPGQSLFSGPAAPPATSLFSSSAPTTSSLFSQPSTGSLFSSGAGSSAFAGGSAGTSLFSGVGSGPSSLFPTTQPSAIPAKSGDDNDEDGGDDGDEEEVDPLGPTKQAEKVVNENEEILCEVEPCKIKVLKEKDWVDRAGKGRAIVSRDKVSGKFRVVLRAGTTGKIFFNAPVNSSMKSSLKQVKNKVLLMTVAFSEENGSLKPDNDGKPSMYTFMASTEDEAVRLNQALEKAMSE